MKIEFSMQSELLRPNEKRTLFVSYCMSIYWRQWREDVQIIEFAQDV